MLLKKRLWIVFLVLFALVLILLKGISLSEKNMDKKIILTAIRFGTEIKPQTSFVNKLTSNTRLQKENIKIFLGQYALLMGHVGFLMPDPPNYYVFIDMYFYYSLNQDEKEALIAHELGHAVYETEFLDKLQLKIPYQFVPFSELHRKILTKYQIRADGFSAEKTSPTAVISLLNKIYFVDRDNPDYKMRVDSLNKLKQGRVR